MYQGKPSQPTPKFGKCSVFLQFFSPRLTQCGVRFGESETAGEKGHIDFQVF